MRSIKLIKFSKIFNIRTLIGLGALIVIFSCAPKAKDNTKELPPYIDLTGDAELFQKTYNEILSQEEQAELIKSTKSLEVYNPLEVWNRLPKAGSSSIQKFQLISGFSERSFVIPSYTAYPVYDTNSSYQYYIGYHLPSKIPQLRYMLSREVNPDGKPGLDAEDNKGPTEEKDVHFYENGWGSIKTFLAGQLGLEEESPGIFSAKANSIEKSKLMLVLMNYFPDLKSINDLSFENLLLLTKEIDIFAKGSWKENASLLNDAFRALQNNKLEDLNDDEVTAYFVLQQWVLAQIITLKGIIGAPKLKSNGTVANPIRGFVEEVLEKGLFSYTDEHGRILPLVISQNNVSKMDQLLNQKIIFSDGSLSLKEKLDILNFLITPALYRNPNLWYVDKSSPDYETKLPIEILKLSIAMVALGEKAIRDDLVVIENGTLKENHLKTISDSELASLIDAGINFYRAFGNSDPEEDRRMLGEEIYKFLHQKKKNSVFSLDDVLSKFKVVLLMAVGEGRARVRAGSKDKELVEALYRAHYIGKTNYNSVLK